MAPGPTFNTEQDMKLTVVNIRMLKTQQSHFSSSSSSSNSSNNNNSNSINQAFSSSFRRTLSTRPDTRITTRSKRGNWSQLLVKFKLFSTPLAKQSNRQSHKYQKHRLKLSPRSPVNHTEPRSSTRPLPRSPAAYTKPRSPLSHPPGYYKPRSKSMLPQISSHFNTATP